MGFDPKPAGENWFIVELNFSVVAFNGSAGLKARRHFFSFQHGSQGPPRLEAGFTFAQVARRADSDCSKDSERFRQLRRKRGERPTMRRLGDRRKGAGLHAVALKLKLGVFWGFLSEAT